MRDPYTVLGVPRQASEAEVKRAYRKLAKANHPDHNADDPKAKERFAEINQAYEIIGDKEKRKQFDAGEIDAEGKPKFKGFEGFTNAGRGGRGGFEAGEADFSDIFSRFGFGGGGGGSSRTFRFTTGGPGGRTYESTDGGFSQEDILRGLFGSGGAGERPSGSGGADVEANVAVTLEDVMAGRKPKVSLPTGRTVQVTLPKGVQDGQVIRLKGQGGPSPSGGPPGDALVTVKFVPHPRFRVEGSDLHTSVEVPLEDAVLGGKVTVPTLDGEVRLTVPPMSSSGKVMRLRGKGLPTKTGHGDLLATLQIVLPEGGDAELQALMQRRRAAATTA